MKKYYLLWHTTDVSCSVVYTGTRFLAVPGLNKLIQPIVPFWDNQSPVAKATKMTILLMVCNRSDRRWKKVEPKHLPQSWFCLILSKPPPLISTLTRNLYHSDKGLYNHMVLCDDTFYSSLNSWGLPWITSILQSYLTSTVDLALSSPWLCQDDSTIFLPYSLTCLSISWTYLTKMTSVTHAFYFV